MKKKLLTGVFGLGLMLSFVSVRAETIDNIEEGTNSTSADVTVWNVETSSAPVYDVEITWADLTFNWSYDEETGSYVWKKNDISSLEGSLISITDNSINVDITPSIEWNSATNYDWTTAKFYSHYKCYALEETEFAEKLADGHVFSDSTCSNLVEDQNVTWSEGTYYSNDLIYLPYSDNGKVAILENEITNSEISDSFRINSNNTYEIHMILEIDETKEIITPQVGDTIGTITISIK